MPLCYGDRMPPAHEAGVLPAGTRRRLALLAYMITSLIKVPSQKIPVPKITMQTKSHNLNFNVLSSVVDSSGDEV